MGSLRFEKIDLPFYRHTVRAESAQRFQLDIPPTDPLPVHAHVFGLRGGRNFRYESDSFALFRRDQPDLDRLPVGIPQVREQHAFLRHALQRRLDRHRDIDPLGIDLDAFDPRYAELLCGSRECGAPSDEQGDRQ